jgi:hypothetical protein
VELQLQEDDGIYRGGNLGRASDVKSWKLLKTAKIEEIAPEKRLTC